MFKDVARTRIALHLQMELGQIRGLLRKAGDVREARAGPLQRIFHEPLQRGVAKQTTANGDGADAESKSTTRHRTIKDLRVATFQGSRAGHDGAEGCFGEALTINHWGQKPSTLLTQTGLVAVKELPEQKKPQKRAGARVPELIKGGKLGTFST